MTPSSPRVLRCAWLLCGGLMVARAHAGTTTSIVPPVTKHTLPNGVTILIREDHSSRLAAASVFVRVGAQNETRANAGIRAFALGLLLRAAVKAAPAQSLSLLEARGGGLDVEIGDDYVEVYATGAGADVAALLKSMGQAFAATAFEAQEIESVRAELLAQVRLRNDDLRRTLTDTLRAELFRDRDGEPAQYGLPLVGFADSLQRLRREDLVEFFRAHFTASHLVVVISGDVAPAEILREAQPAFRKLANGPLAPSASPPVPLSAAPALEIVQSPAPQAWVAIGFPVPGVGHPDYPALAVLANLLGRGMRSRLFVDFRQLSETARAYEVGAELNVRRHQCDFVVFAQVDAMAIDEAKNRILDQLERLRTEAPSPAELERARKITVGAFLLEHQRQRQRAHHLALFEALGVGYQFDAEYPERVRRVTVEDIRRVARAHFQRRAIVVAMPAPQAGDESRPQ